MTRTSSKATKPRQYVFPSVSRGSLQGIRREVHSLRVRERNWAREGKERDERITRITTAGRAAEIESAIADENELLELERELKELSEQKKLLYDELKSSLDAPPPTPLPKPFHQVRRNLKAGVPLTPPAPHNSDVSKRP